MILNFENSKFLTALTQKVLQGIKKSFDNAHWDIKVYWILLDTLWNSTTVTMLLCIHIFFTKVYNKRNIWQNAWVLSTCNFEKHSDTHYYTHNDVDPDISNSQFKPVKWLLITNRMREKNYGSPYFKLGLIHSSIRTMRLW